MLGRAASPVPVPLPVRWRRGSPRRPRPRWRPGMSADWTGRAKAACTRWPQLAPRGGDFAQAAGQQAAASDEVARHVLGLPRQIITPEARGGGSFADPIEAGPDAGLLDRLIALTGRTKNP